MELLWTEWGTVMNPWEFFSISFSFLDDNVIGGVVQSTPRVRVWSLRIPTMGADGGRWWCFRRKINGH
jgi:hypothetical protein